MTAPEDYVAGPYIIMISAGQTNFTFPTPINNDTIVEGNETITITIDQSSLPDDCTAHAVGSAIVMIIDDDHK